MLPAHPSSPLLLQPQQATARIPKIIPMRKTSNYPEAKLDHSRRILTANRCEWLVRIRLWTHSSKKKKDAGWGEQDSLTSDLDRKKAEQQGARQEIQVERYQGQNVDGGTGWRIEIEGLSQA